VSATFIQGVSSPRTSYPLTLVLPNPVTVGNRIIVLFLHSYAGCVPSVADSLGNGSGGQYGRDGAQLNISGGGHFNVFSAPVTTGGSCTITVSAACGAMLVGFCIEVSGLDASPFDDQQGNLNSTTSCDAGTITTTAADDYVLALFAAGATGNQSFTPTGGATTLLTISGDGSILQAQTQAAAGSVTPTATGSGSSFATYPAAAGSVAYKVASTGTINSGDGAAPSASLALAIGAAIASGSGASPAGSAAFAIGSAIAGGSGASTSISQAAPASMAIALGTGAAPSTSYGAGTSSAIIIGLGTAQSLSVNAAYAAGMLIASGAGLSLSPTRAAAAGSATAAGAGSASSPSVAIAAGAARALGIGSSVSVSFVRAVAGSTATVPPMYPPGRFRVIDIQARFVLADGIAATFTPILSE
jgi:hypothetical protein